MGRPKKIDKQREQEVLNSEVRIDGKGEEPVVRDMLSPQFVTMSDREALQITAMLSKLITGQEKTNDEMARLNERMDNYDKAAAAWENDRQKMFREITERAEKYKTPEAMARGALETKKLVAEANAIAKTQAMEKNLMIEKRIANDPKASVVSPGKVEKVTTESGIEVRVVPETITVGRHRWTLKPGEITEVPLIVAEAWKLRNQDLEYAKKVKNVIAVKDSGESEEQGTVIAKVNRLAKEYGKSGMNDSPLTLEN